MREGGERKSSLLKAEGKGGKRGRDLLLEGGKGETSLTAIAWEKQ